VACCKEHKLFCEDAKKEEQDEIADGIDKSAAGGGTLLTGIDLLDDAQLEKLRKDPYIRQMLGSKRLQEHIRCVDEAADRPQALKKIRSKNEEFHVFVGRLLDCVVVPSVPLEKKPAAVVAPLQELEQQGEEENDEGAEEAADAAIAVTSVSNSCV
jgi:hypothetical protein